MKNKRQHPLSSVFASKFIYEYYIRGQHDYNVLPADTFYKARQHFPKFPIGCGKEPLLPASFYIVAMVASLLISVIQTLMLIRAVLSWFPVNDASPFIRFIYGATEPFILPVRALLDRFSFFRSMPIDMSFLFTFLILSFLRSLL